MKRSEVKKVMEDKSYRMDLTELFKVTFLKDFGAFKKSESTCVSLPIALKWINSGAVSTTPEIKSALDENSQELIESKKNKKDNDL